jgi:hypothetical protein
VYLKKTGDSMLRSHYRYHIAFPFIVLNINLKAPSKEGNHGNTDCFGGGHVGRIHGNSALFPVEYGPKG